MEKSMTHLVPAVALIVLASMLPASAQTPLRANERYCLLAYDNTGPNALLCRFESVEQCNMSKAGSMDRCLINPELTFQQPRPYRR
jgi:hypothetical protein